MSSSSQDRESVCEECGAPLSDSQNERGCLECREAARASAPGPADSWRRTYLHYEILKRPDDSPWELGRSELGITYKAYDVNLDTIVALKVMAPAFSARPEVREELRQAVQAAARVHHPHVAEVFHFGTVEAAAGPNPTEKSTSGECFYTMEFVEGESLERRIRRDGPLPPLLALEIALQAARALAEAETRSLTPGGLKPSNVILASELPLALNAADSRHRPAVWIKVIGLGLGVDRPGDIPAADASGTNLSSLGQILTFALTGAPADHAGNVAQLRGRRIPPPVIELLELIFASAGEKSPLFLASVIGRIENVRTSLGERTSRRRRWAVAGILALMGGMLGLALSSQPWASPQEKSLAVLPFRSLSQNPGDALFAEGLRDDVVSRLARIPGLKVISHLPIGVATNRASDFVSMGRAVGARHLLTGDVRRSGDRVRFGVSLIDASNGQQVWSENYDRQAKDAINLQGELASNVAATLTGRVGGRERTRAPASATANSDAYVLYLRGRKLENSVSTEVSNYEAAAALYGQAIALDPDFALAHAQLASVLGMLYRFRGPSEEVHNQAANEVQEALRLQPNLGEAHLAKGANLYRIERDFERALAELNTAQRLMPNDAAPRAFIALIHRRQGRWREARAGLEEAHRLDPQVRKYVEELHATACLLRDWPTAARYIELALAMTPDVTQLKGERALVNFWQTGDLGPLRRIFGPKHLSGAREDATWAGWDTAMLARDFWAAQAALDTYRLDSLPTVLGAPIPKSYLRGCVWLAQGERAQAQTSFESARPSLEAETFAQPGDAMRHARLGLLYAYLGKKNEALREGKRAVELSPVSEDAVDGHYWACNLALIHARVGNTAEAEAMIESLLRQPGCVSPLNEASLSLSDLRLRWQWDPLRSDPHFQRILAGPEPSTAY